MFNYTMTLGFLLVFFSTSALGTGLGTGLDANVEKPSFSDMITFTTHQASLDSSAIKDVLDLMQKGDAMPSCNKIAVSGLLNTCAGLDNATTPAAATDALLLLDDAQKFYAARLAVCELLEANAKIPESCSAFKPNDHTSRVTGVRGWFANGVWTKPVEVYQNYDDATTQQFEACTAALSERHIWSSYSNARQNSALLCKSVKAGLEKELQIDMLNTIIEAHFKVATETGKTSADLQTAVADMLNIFHEMESFHKGLNQNLDGMKEKVADLWSCVHADVQDLREGLKEAGSDAAAMHDHLRNAEADMMVLRETTKETALDLVDHRSFMKNQFSDVVGSLSNVALMTNKLGLALLQTENLSSALVSDMGSLVLTLVDAFQHVQALDAIVTDLNHNVTEVNGAISDFKKNATPGKILSDIGHSLVADRLPSMVFSMVAMAGFFAYFDSFTSLTVLASAVLSLTLGIASGYLISFVPWTNLSFPTLAVDMSTVLSSPAAGMVLMAIFAFGMAYYGRMLLKKKATLVDLHSTTTSSEKA